MLHQQTAHTAAAEGGRNINGDDTTFDGATIACVLADDETGEGGVLLSDYRDETGGVDKEAEFAKRVSDVNGEADLVELK
jgi:hypothetical protein